MNAVKSLTSAWSTLRLGLSLTLKHFIASRHSRKKTWITEPGYSFQDQGIATVQYPHEMIPVPETGRYKLHNEIDDCIVCDKCAKICPVNCITIEPIKSPEEFGKTSDGTPKRIFAAKFDIDMGKCCFCGLCTTVCPTECLTMTPDYDYSTFNILEHNFVFGNMEPAEIAARKKQWEDHAAAQPEGTPSKPSVTGAAARPVMKPKINPSSPS
jgi:formate hydrogenlyase subunit 6/NADH:ubiquinone oxidoreductase subunit I